jgi:cell wall-associated NlpC family hydrolase
VSPTAATTAIQWAEQFLKPGSDRSKDSGYCLQFVSEAYEAAGIDIGTVGDANGAAYYWEHDKNGYPEHKEDTNPPIGALVFWGATPSGPISYVNPNGHVGIYIGDNTVISTWAYPEPKSDPYVFEFPLTGPGSRNAAGYPYLGWLSPTS